MTNIVTVSDISAALTGAAFGNVYGFSMQQQAIQSFAVSVIARIASRSDALKNVMIVDMDASQKNQLVVAVLSALGSYWRKHSPMKGAFTGVAVDLVAEEAVRILGMSDKAVFTTSGAAKGPAGTTTGGSAGP